MRVHVASLFQYILRSVNRLLFQRCCGMDAKSVESEALEEFFSPPASVRGSTVLNREDFRRDVTLPAIGLRDASLVSRFMQRLPHALLRFPTIKRVVSCVNREDGKVEKVILLTPVGSPPGNSSSLSEEDRVWIRSNGGEETTHTVALDYSHFSIYATLRALLPLQLKEVPTGFETVGHIAHFNLRNEYLPFKKIIGQVVLDKQKNIRTVVNKINQIDDTFRFFKMEVLAGDDDLIATVKENGCTFSFDFSKVYWNSRLHSEHERLVKEFKKSDVVIDMFAGVGPFSIPAAKKGCTVYANDLNPHSYEYLCSNAERNGIMNNLTSYNLDGRVFVKEIIAHLLLQSCKDGVTNFDNCVFSVRRNEETHIIMNLPATAVDFLDSFRGLFSNISMQHRDSAQLPIIHCYCFSKSEAAPEEDALEMVKRNLGVATLPDGTYSTYCVRRVAPNKVMMKVSFRLPAEVAFDRGDGGDQKDPTAVQRDEANKRISRREEEANSEEETSCSVQSPSLKRRRLE